MLSKGAKHIVAALSVRQSVRYLVRQITTDPMSYGPLVNSKFKNFNLVRSKTQNSFHFCCYNILPKFVNQLIASSIQIIQIDSRHLLSYYKPISLVYYYMGVFCDIWTLLLKTDTYVAGIIENAIINVFLFCTNSVSRH